MVAADADGVGGDITQAMALAEGVAAGGADDARCAQQAAPDSLADLFSRVELPALLMLPLDRAAHDADDVERRPRV